MHDFLLSVRESNPTDETATQYDIAVWFSNVFVYILQVLLLCATNASVLRIQTVEDISDHTQLRQQHVNLLKPCVPYRDRMQYLTVGKQYVNNIQTVCWNPLHGGTRQYIDK